MAGSPYDLNKLGSILFKDRDTRDPWINHLDEKYYIKHRFQKPGNVIEIDGSDIHLPQDAAPAKWFGSDVDPAELPLMKDKYLRQPTILGQGLPEMLWEFPGQVRDAFYAIPRVMKNINERNEEWENYFKLIGRDPQGNRAQTPSFVVPGNMRRTTGHTLRGINDATPGINPLKKEMEIRGLLPTGVELPRV